ncbi:MAG: class I SAM-dependent methyltransferase [Gemmatimonadota bacterium]
MSLLRVAGAAALFALAVSVTAQPKSREDCERTYKPQIGQTGKDVIWVPTPDDLVTRMLTMAHTTPRDYVVDLGAGDGKIAIAAAKEFGARALGIEYNPDMVRLAQCMTEVEGVASKAKIIQGDVFKEDFSQATVVTMYLLPELNLRLRPIILNMRPGTRVVSHQFTMGDWEPDQSATIEHRSAYLWIVPAKVEGTWNFHNRGGSTQFTVSLSQKYQRISGDAFLGAHKQPIVGASLHGDEIRFAFNDDKEVTQTLTGRVHGGDITGTLKAAGDGEVPITGKRK